MYHLLQVPPLIAVSNSYIVKVGGQSTILSPGSSTQLQHILNNNKIRKRLGIVDYCREIDSNRHFNLETYKDTKFKS
jgi:hypothetical protein